MQEKRYLIYGLIDPDSQELRYIGQTIHGLLRPVSHWMNKRQRTSGDYCHCWVRNVLSRGKIPEILIIEESENSSQLDKSEEFWIEYFRSIGCPLTNMSS